MEYLMGTYGGRRVHREYVDVVARFARDGAIDPVCVMWRDGRSFPIDEVVERGAFGVRPEGRQTARYRVRFGRHETCLYLERMQRASAPDRSPDTSETLRWWVYAFDQTKPGAAVAGTC